MVYIGAHNLCTRNSDEISVALHWFFYVVFTVLFIHIIREFIILVRTLPIYYYYYYYYYNIDIAGNQRLRFPRTSLYSYRRIIVFRMCMALCVYNNIISVNLFGRKQSTCFAVKFNETGEN